MASAAVNDRAGEIAVNPERNLAFRPIASERLAGYFQGMSARKACETDRILLVQALLGDQRMGSSTMPVSDLIWAKSLERWILERKPRRRYRIEKMRLR